MLGNKNHRVIRNNFQWGTYGKYLNEELRWITLKDITDSHLMHIVGFIRINNGYYTKNIVDIINDEVEYRVKNNIFIE